MRWKAERAVVEEGWSTWVVVNAETFQVNSEVLDYVIALESADRSPNTIRSYSRSLATFLTWTWENEIDWRTIKLMELMRFKRFLQTEVSSQTRRFRSERTVSVTLTAVTQFLRYCYLNHLIDTDAARKLVEGDVISPLPGAQIGESANKRKRGANPLRVKSVEKSPEVLSDEQILSMLQNARTMRDKFLIQLMTDGGMRIGEVLGLQDIDVHLLPSSASLGCAVEGPHFHVVRRMDNENSSIAKSVKPRHVPATRSTVDAFREYQFEKFSMVGQSDSAQLFVNYKGAEGGRAMSYSNAYQLIKRLGQKAGFRATPHMFRHTAATQWIRRGVDVDVVQSLLGHSLASSTNVYLHASDRRLREAVDQLKNVQGEA